MAKLNKTANGKYFLGPLGFEFPKSVSRDSLIYLSPIDVTIARVMSWQQIDLIFRESAGTFTRVRTNELALKKWADQQLGEVQIKVSQRLSALKIPRIGPKGVPIEVPHVMAVLNVTPDSFSDGGNYSTPDQAISAGIKMASYGADIIDVGGDSTRPKSMQPSAIIEEERVLPVVRGLVKAGLTVSIDTRRPEVMVKGASEGAAILNDVSSLYGSEKSIKVVSSLGLPIILTHMQGIPENMQDNPTYNAAPFDIFDWLETRVLDCQKSGIMSKKIIIDPGIGFGKTLNHNIEILSNLGIFHGLGCPICIGVSRKSFIGNLGKENNPKRRLAGSLAAMLHCVKEGVQIIRVHDVKETVQALSVYRSIKQRFPDQRQGN